MVFSFNNQMFLWNPSTFDGTATDQTDARTHLEASSAFYLDIPELTFKTFSNNDYLTKGNNLNKIDILFKKIEKNND